MQCYANLLVTYYAYAKEFVTSKVSLTFSIYLFRFIAGRKKILCILRHNSKSYLLLAVVAAFCFCERALYHFGKREITMSQQKRTILLSPRQISKKFLKYSVNAFTAKKNVIALAICLLKNPNASIWQKAKQENYV